MVSSVTLKQLVDMLRRKRSNDRERERQRERESEPVIWSFRPLPLLQHEARPCQRTGAGRGSEDLATLHRGEESPGLIGNGTPTFATFAASEVPTQAFWAPSPGNTPQRESRALARQSFHRRRRLHAAFLDTPENVDLDELD